MRIESSQTFSSYGQRATGNASSELFESTLLKADKKEEKPEEKKGKLVTAREGAYVRQYLVGADGSKILISEIKQAEEDTTSTGNYAPSGLRESNLSESGMSRNNKEMIDLLNLQMGAGLPFAPNKGLSKSEE
jgi:hypothetical protein